MTSFTTYVGTYTDRDGEGIYRGQMDESAGSLADVTLVAETANPSFLAVWADGEVLCAVNGLEDGAVTALEIGPDGGLTAIDQRVVGPADPCHCSVDPTGAFLFVAHYTGGAVSVLPLADDGTLGDPTVIEHEGSSVHPERQTAPHPHSVNVGPDGDRLYVPDLGTDEIVVYGIDRDEGTLEYRDAVGVHEGAGPRHLAFHDGDAYLINELDSTLSRFAWNPDSGALERVTTVDTLPEPHDENYPADVAVHPDGDRVYGSNRGHDSIAVVDSTDDGLELLETMSTHGQWPRNVALSPNAEYLFAANQHTDTVVPLEIGGDGGLSATDDSISVPEPVCILPVEEA